MSDTLTTAQLRRALSAAAELAAIRDLRGFPAAVAGVLRTLVPCDHVSYNVIDIVNGRARVVADPPDVVFEGGPEMLARWGHQNPMLAYDMTTPERQALRLSDFISRRALHRTELDGYCYGLIPLEYQMTARLGPPRAQAGGVTEIVGLSFSRRSAPALRCPTR